MNRFTFYIINENINFLWKFKYHGRIIYIDFLTVANDGRKSEKCNINKSLISWFESRFWVSLSVTLMKIWVSLGNIRRLVSPVIYIWDPKGKNLKINNNKNYIGCLVSSWDPNHIMKISYSNHNFYLKSKFLYSFNGSIGKTDFFLRWVHETQDLIYSPCLCRNRTEGGWCHGAFAGDNCSRSSCRILFGCTYVYLVWSIFRIFHFMK